MVCHALFAPPLNDIVGREAVCCLSLNKPFVVVVAVVVVKVFVLVIQSCNGLFAYGPLALL